MIPTKRSVNARLQNRTLDGGWSEVSLCRTTRIKVFPRNAVTDRRLFTTERKINSPSTSPVNSSISEHWFSCLLSLLSLVKFVSAISLWCDDLQVSTFNSNNKSVWKWYHFIFNSNNQPGVRWSPSSCYGYELLFNKNKTTISSSVVSTASVRQKTDVVMGSSLTFNVITLISQKIPITKLNISL